MKNLKLISESVQVPPHRSRRLWTLLVLFVALFLGANVLGLRTDSARKYEVKSQANGADVTSRTPTKKVPETGTLLLVGTGLLSIAGLVRRRFVS